MVRKMPADDFEKAACQPVPVNPNKFNPHAVIPYGCTTEHIMQAMRDFTDFLCLINTQLNSKGLERLESFLMPANFSSIVGEFMTSAVPKYCTALVKNTYHNGHPDMLPRGRFPNDAMQHGKEGIEVKGSRHLSGWQGHNAEETWLMVFIFDSNAARDRLCGAPPKPFKFVKVLGAQLVRTDWAFSGRSETSRRTITASVTESGRTKMEANWIYSDQ
jgi:hypothetical protein